MKRILFEDITLVEDAPYLHKPFSFHIEVSGKQHHYLRGESFAEQRDWISELSKRSPNMKKLPEGMNSLSNYKHYSLNPNTQIPPSNPVKKEPNSLLNDPFVLPSQSPSNSSLSSGSGRKEDSDENMKKYHEYKDKKKNKEKNKIRLVYVYGDNEEKKVDLTAAACSMKITKYETKNEGKKDMYTVRNFLIFFVSHSILFKRVIQLR